MHVEGVVVGGGVGVAGKAKKRKRAGYWKSYDARVRNHGLRGTFLQLLMRVGTLPPPYLLSGRGGRAALTPHEAAAFQVLKVHFDLTLRDLEAVSDLLLGVHVDHSTFQRHFDRIPPHYMGRVAGRLDEEIRERLQQVAWYLIADSTKVPLDRQYATTRVGTTDRMVQKQEQFHVLSMYAPQVGIVTVTRAHTGVMGEVQALQNQLQTMPDHLLQGRGLLADRGYDAEALFRTLYQRGAIPIIKQRAWGTTRAYRGKAQRDYSPEAYHDLRGIVEGIFGGLHTRHSLHIRSRKKRTQQRDDLALAASHNLQSLLRLLTFKEVGTPRAG